MLIILLVAAHLLAVNLAAGGPIVAVTAEWRARRRNDAASENAAKTLAIWSLAATVLGVLLGLIALVLLMLWPPLEDADYRAAILQIPTARWWFTAAEIVFYLVCMAAYFGLWNKLTRHRVWHRLLAILAGTNLLYHFPAIFTILAVVATRPSLHGKPIDRSLYLQLFGEAEVLSRVIHVVLACLAVAGLTLAWIAGRTTTNQPTQTNATPTCLIAATHGARWALACSLLQIPVGLWVLLSLPTNQQNRVLGEHLLGTALFAISILLALALLHQLAMLSLGDISRRRLQFAVGLMVAVIVLMTATLHLARAKEQLPVANSKIWPRLSSAAKPLSHPNG